MPCARPLLGWRGREGKIVFEARKAISSDIVRVGCGQCRFCRKQHAREWAVRALCEASCHEDNQFLTLTYDRKNPIYDGALHVEHLQKFFKRYRKWVSTWNKCLKVRYIAVGEYGKSFQHPHYHACVFGHQFLGEIKLKEGLYRNSKLEELWPFGYSSIGPMCFETAAYVAKYSLKKIRGNDKAVLRAYLDPSTGEIRKSPFLVCSHGIGKDWFMKFKSEVFPDDEVVVTGGDPVHPPRFFMRLLELTDPDLAVIVKSKRLINSIPAGERYRRERASEIYEESVERLDTRHGGS